jgi:hypothetical protein
MVDVAQVCGRSAVKSHLEFDGRVLRGALGSTKLRPCSPTTGAWAEAGPGLIAF